MSILYVGDLHGYLVHYQEIDDYASEHAVSAVIQCGDFGIFWPGKEFEVPAFFQQRTSKIPWYFVDGNHDNHDKLHEMWIAAGSKSIVEVASNCFHMRRGSTLEIEGVKHLMCGGASSTDRAAGYREFFNDGENVYRIWWPNEAPSSQELSDFATLIESYKPDVIVTHEAPYNVELYRSGRFDDPTARGFYNAHRLSTHKASRWFFGHHHVLHAWSEESTTYFGCGFHGEAWLWNGSKAFAKMSRGAENMPEPWLTTI